VGDKVVYAAVLRPYYNRFTLQQYKMHIMLLVEKVFQGTDRYLLMHQIAQLVVESIPYFLPPL
jgi:hypothetical protein